MNVTFEEVPVGKIKPDPNNPRKTFDEGQLAELADSIKLHGVQTPIRLRKNGDGDSYVIVAGERRYHAAKLAKLKTIPAVIAETSAAQVEALVENLHREDLNPIEEGDAYRALSDGGMVDEAIAAAVARPVERIRDRIGLSRLPESGRAAALAGLPLGVLRDFVALNEQGGRDLVNALLVCADKTNGWSRGPWQLYFALDREDPSIVEKECEACGGDGEIGEDGEYCKACGGAGAVTTRVEGAGWPEFFAVALWASTPLEDMQIEQLPEDAREKVEALRKQAHEFHDAQAKGGGYYAPPPTIGMDDATLKDAAVAAGVTVSFDSDRLVVTDPLWVAEYLPDLYAKKVEEYVAGDRGSGTKKAAGKKSDAELTPAERKEKEARAKARQEEVEQRAAGRVFNTKLATTILTKARRGPGHDGGDEAARRHDHRGDEVGEGVRAESPGRRGARAVPEVLAARLADEQGGRLEDAALRGRQVGVRDGGVRADGEGAGRGEDAAAGARRARPVPRVRPRRPAWSAAR